MRSHPTPPRSRFGQWRGFFVMTLALAGLAAACLSRRPLPFSTTDDGPIYFLPLIKLHTDEALSGHLPRMFWQLGSGWTPLESAQVGPFYVPYHLSNLIARALGRPLALLEVSAWLHLWLTGALSLLLLPKSIEGPARVAWALLLALQPAPFLLGLNWHDYLASYPWFVALSLLILNKVQSGGSWERGSLLGLALASALFFMAAHPQMYLIGVACLALLAFAITPREGAGRAVLALGWAQLPLVVPLLFIKVAVDSGNPDWMWVRRSPLILLASAQHIDTALFGVLFGNLLGGADFRIWPQVSESGIGMYFSPALVVSMIIAARHRRWVWLAVASALLLLAGVASFPLLRHIVPSALGLRWTWKLTFFLGPLAAVVLVAWLGDLVRDGRRRAVAVGAAAIASGLVCFRGLDFDLLPSLRAMYDLGVQGIVEETRQLLRGAGLSKDTRVALIAKQSIYDTTLSVPFVGLIGNAPVLAGYESAHLYEPLESGEAARSHLSLSTPWRIAVDPEAYVREPAIFEARLQQIGVEALVTATAGVFGPEGSLAVTDSLGRKTYIRKLGPSPVRFPWATVGDERVPLERAPGGVLVTKEPTTEQPTLVVPRKVRWSRRDDGRWQAIPRPVRSPWIVATALAVALTAGLFWLGLGLFRRPS